MSSDHCSMCGVKFPETLLEEAHWYPFWELEGGGCPACVQDHLLRTLLTKGDAALHESMQSMWPLDPEAAFGVLPTNLRMHADPRFRGRGVTIAIADSGFCPHPDLIQPYNRILAWVDASREPVLVHRFESVAKPSWPDSDGARDWHWHGTMTSVVAAGNGFLSHGLYGGMAPEAELVLIQLRDPSGNISTDSILRALNWILAHADEFNLKLVSLSVSGDPISPLAGNPIDEAIAALAESGVTVVAAAGNNGERLLTPPATAPLGITVGGIDDHNLFSHEEIELWHSNYGDGSNEMPKPDVVAPSIWVAAPILPRSLAAQEAAELFAQRRLGDAQARARIEERKLITPHYQHAEGTSFAAPIVGSLVACMLEANAALTPVLIREILRITAESVPGVESDRQGAGAIVAGRAVARALSDRHGRAARFLINPRVSAEGISFALHDHKTRSVRVLGSWDDWRSPGLQANCIESGYWETVATKLPSGRYAYKFLLDDDYWLDDPANPSKVHDGRGGFNSVAVVR